jgi:ribose transport system substrate-binding protein
MIRSFWRVAAVSIAVALASGCGGGGDGGEQPADTPSGQRPKVALVLSSSQLSAGKEMAAGFQNTAGLLGAEAVVSGPPLADPPKQAEIFKEMMNSAKGGIAIQATDAELIARELAAAVQGGFPVIAVDIKPAATSGVKTFVGNDNHQLGELLADELIGRLPAGSTGTVLVGSTRPGLAVMEQRMQGIRDRFAAKLPGVKVAGPFDTQTDVTANLASWKRLAAASPGALALIGTGSTDGPSIATVHAETKGKWLGAGFDLHPKTIAGLKDGELVAIASPEHYMAGALAGWLQARHAQDGTPLPQGWVQTPSLVITTKNLPEIIERQQSDEEKAAWFKPRIDEITADLPTHVRPLNPAG